MNKRLTQKLPNGVVKRTDVVGDSVTNRLYAYEETGYSPEEVVAVMALAEKMNVCDLVRENLCMANSLRHSKAENERLKAERDAAIQVVYSCPTCSNCTHEPECSEIGGRCEGRGYGGDCHEPYDEPHFKWREMEDATCD